MAEWRRMIGGEVPWKSGLEIRKKWDYHGETGLSGNDRGILLFFFLIVSYFAEI